MQWRVHGRRTIYDSPWISLDRVDVEQPDGNRYEQPSQPRTYANPFRELLRHPPVHDGKMARRRLKLSHGRC